MSKIGNILDEYLKKNPNKTKEQQNAEMVDLLTGIYGAQPAPVQTPVQTSPAAQTTAEAARESTSPQSFDPIIQTNPQTTNLQGVNNIPTFNQNVLTEHFLYTKPAPTYTSKYSAEIDALYNQLMNTPQFTYDHRTDPKYQAYEKVYTEAGHKAMQDTLGEVAARTGGIASSYATAAASQAQNRYMQELSNIIPELENTAYGRYMNEIQKKQNDLAMLKQLEAADYDRYQNDLNRYYQDLAFEYQKYLDQYNMNRDAQAFAYQQYLDNYNMEQDKENTAYQREQDAYARAWDETQRQWAQEDRANDRAWADTQMQWAQEDRKAEKAQEALEKGWDETQRQWAVEDRAWENTQRQWAEEDRANAILNGLFGTSTAGDGEYPDGVDIVQYAIDEAVSASAKFWPGSTGINKNNILFVFEEISRNRNITDAEKPAIYDVILSNGTYYNYFVNALVESGVAIDRAEAADIAKSYMQ